LSENPDLALQLDALGGDIHGPLQEVSVPMYILDRDGTIVWLNDAGRDLIPEATGRNFKDVLPAEIVQSSRRHFALRMLGHEPFVDHRLAVTAPSGERHDVEISSAPLRRDHRIVGGFGVMHERRRAAPPPAGGPPPATLTPRQHEVLRLLGAGLTTRQMAERRGVSIETVLNHVRMVLSQLGARSRLEAVLLAHRRGLLDRPGATSD
jgi:DNA-binding CsgD family transcriptional regulator